MPTMPEHSKIADKHQQHRKIFYLVSFSSFKDFVLYNIHSSVAMHFKIMSSLSRLFAHEIFATHPTPPLKFLSEKRPVLNG